MLVVVAWIVVLVGAFALGVNVSALCRAPRHLKTLLQNSQELARIVAHFDPAKLREEARGINPLVSFSKDLNVWEQAHRISLRRPRNILLALGVVDLIGAYFVSHSCFLLASGVFVFPWLFPTPASAKNNNVLHLRTVILNLLKWHEANQAECQEYCEVERPELAVLHGIVVTMP